MANAARTALYAGRPERAYRLIETAMAQGSNRASLLKLEARIYVGLGMPLRAAGCYARIKKPSALERARMAAILQRQAPRAGLLSLRIQSGGKIFMGRHNLRRVRGLLPAREGGIYLLTRDSFLTLDSKGLPGEKQSMSDAKDLSLGPEGKPVALDETHILWGKTMVPLPTGLKKPVSVAASPDGNLILLDAGTRKLYRLSAKGKPLGGAVLLMKHPIKVRVDGSGRIYVADRNTGTVHVFGADLSPIRTIVPEKAVHLRRLGDIAVDFSGNVLMLDSRRHTLSLFSSKGRFLGKVGGNGIRIDCAGWNGLDTIVFADRKHGFIGRISL